MEDFKAKKNEFIAHWGVLGSSWGINRTMAQIHALLIVSVEPMTYEEIMDELKISRGNANSNLRELLSWGLIKKVIYPGDRKEYFEAYKDVWKMFTTVARERKRREIEPALEVLTKFSDEQIEVGSEEEKMFYEQIGSIKDMMGKADTILEKISKSEESKVVQTLLKLL